MADSRVIVVNFEGVDSGGGRGAHVPEGDYGLKVTKITQEVGEDSGKPYLLFIFEIIQGNKKGIGKKIFHNCTLQKQGLWNLRGMLESMGVKVPSAKLKIPLDKLIGKGVAATLTDDEYEGKKKSIVAAFFPMSDLGSTDEGEGFGEEETETKTKKKGKKEEVEEPEEEESSEEGDLFS